MEPAKDEQGGRAVHQGGYARGVLAGEQRPGWAATQGDPFALRLDSVRLRALYLDAEGEDGYHRDQNVFGAGVTIEDDMAVLVRYRSGATMTYQPDGVVPLGGLPRCGPVFRRLRRG